VACPNIQLKDVIEARIPEYKQFRAKNQSYTINDANTMVKMEINEMENFTFYVHLEMANSTCVKEALIDIK